MVPLPQSTYPRLLKAAGVLFILFPTVYFGYFIYLSIYWGAADRLVLLFISDALFFILYIIGAGLLLLKSWSWWLLITLFLQFIFAKIISLAVNVWMIQPAGLSREIAADQIAVEAIYIFFFVTVIVFFSLSPIKRTLGVNFQLKRHLWRVAVGALLLYFIHLIVMAAGLALFTPGN
ncbi:hypothetical protein SAMN05444126_1462 [Salisediminibacterium halotolerans]|uniref:Uncharacterized protein n=1 Tax=Salisediminibacterium halotolerans TaxID=517425 RepID=A0A1H9WSE7_9BACI|nr:hypothetical protein SAMN05444126_1462 [Salisediminibacterium haloalkalitolerans]